MGADVSGVHDHPPPGQVEPDPERRELMRVLAEKRELERQLDQLKSCFAVTTETAEDGDESFTIEVTDEQLLLHLLVGMPTH